MNMMDMYCTCTISGFRSNLLDCEGIETSTWNDSKSRSGRRNKSTFSFSWEGSGTQRARTERRNGMKSWNCSQSDRDDT